LASKDYIIRQIEKFGVILSGIRQTVFAGEVVAAYDQLREFAAKAGVELEFLDALDPGSLLAVIGEQDLARLIVAAEILNLKGEIEEEIGETEKSAGSFVKASLIAGHIRALVGEEVEPAVRARLDPLLESLHSRGY
jgi:hypothetical protein